MSGHLVVAALQPVLAGTAFDEPQAGEHGVTWCTGAGEFHDRHPSAPVWFDPHPNACTDLCVYVDDHGRLERASIEALDLDDGLIGRPIEDVLPALAERVRDLLS